MRGVVCRPRLCHSPIRAPCGGSAGSVHQHPSVLCLLWLPPFNLSTHRLWLAQPSGARPCVWSWLLAFFTNCVTVPVCRQNVISPAHPLVLSSITDQSLDTARRSGQISYGGGEPGHGTSGVTDGAVVGTVFLRSVWTEGHDEHPRSFGKAPVTCSGPTLWRQGYLGCPTGRTCWAKWAQVEAAFWGLGSSLPPPLIPC